MAYSNQYDFQFQSIGKEYNIDPLLLKTIAIKESGINPNVSDNKNSNGTIDVGMMQINSADPQFNQLGGYDVLKNNPLASIRAAAETLVGKASMLKSIGQPVNNFNLLHAYNGWSEQGYNYALDAQKVYNSLGGSGETTNPTGTGTTTAGTGSSIMPSGFTLLSEPSRIFWLVLGGAVVILGLWVAVNPMANLSNVIAGLGKKGAKA